MIRVCEVITRLIVGGAQETAILTCARLDPDAFDASLVTGPQTGPEGSLHGWARELGVVLEVEPSLVRELSLLNELRALFRLWRRFRRERPDVVHTHSSKAGILGRLAARLAGVPAVVHTVHGWSFHEHMPRWERRMYVRLERLAARWTDRFVLVTERDRAKGLSVGIGRPERYSTIRSGVDLAPYRTGDGSGFRAELGIPGRAPVVGTVARLSPQKDPIGFVDAGAEVLEKRPEAHLVFVGDGPMRPEVERRAAELGVADRLHLPGIRRDVPDVVAAFDVFIASSLWEGLPRTVIQAMAAGVPVVASSVDGIAEAVTDGTSGLLVPPGDRRALAEAVLRVLEDTDLAGRLADDGRARAEDFSEGTMIERLEGLYRELADAAGIPCHGRRSS